MIRTKYRGMRLALWGGVQLLVLAICLTPYLIYKFGGEESMATMSAWYWPVGIQAVFSLLWFLEEWKGFPRRGYAVRERDITYRTGCSGSRGSLSDRGSDPNIMFHRYRGSAL